MKLYKLTPKKNTAQAMVEFAIVLPILLLLLYGLLEAGRLLFIYSTIVTASRQAARYGSATGEGITPGIPRYQDCAGIRLAANRVDFLHAFEDDDIVITYDDGPGTAGPNPSTDPPSAPPWKDICDGAQDLGVTPTDNASRIVVTIRGDFLPIVPRIVPFIARTRANNNPIRAVSSRTIITGVPIEVTPPPGSGPGPSLTGLTLTITPSPTTYTAVGQVITFTFKLTNTTNPAVDVNGPFTITYSLDNGATFNSITCPDVVVTPGADATCPTITYQVLQSDLDAARVITITATGSNGVLNSNPATASVPPDLTPALSLTKGADLSLATVGDVVTYKFTLANTGNVTLAPPYVVVDNILGSVDCGSATGNLAPGSSLTCRAPYVVNSAHVQNDKVVNTATVSALFGPQIITSNQASATVNIYTGALFLTVSASPTSVSQVGQVITYSYRLKNNGGAPLYLQASPAPLAGYRGTQDCAAGTSIAPGASITCTGTYTVTQADLDGTISNTITATACTDPSQCNGNRQKDSNSVTVNVSIAANPAISLQATASPLAPTPPSRLMTVGTPITYTYTITNVGNVTLSSPITVTDVAIGSVTCGTSLAPGAVTTCTGTHPVSDFDLNLGYITSHATASALYAARSQTVTATGPQITIITYDGPRLQLNITANPTTYTTTGQAIVFTYTLTNTGTVLLKGPYPVQDPDGTVVFIDCINAKPTLRSGESTSCTGMATLSGPPGSLTTVRGIANASDGTRMIASNTATVTLANPVLGCNTITASIAVPGDTTMTVAINNPNAYSVTIANVVVTWNHDAGHQQGNNNLLNLLNARLGSAAPFWNGPSSAGPSATLTPSTATVIPPGASTITFTFDQNYDRTDGSEAIIINLSTVGCESTPIHRP